MLGEEEVVEVRPFYLHGVAYSDVTIAYRDKNVDTAGALRPDLGA